MPLNCLLTYFTPILYDISTFKFYMHAIVIQVYCYGLLSVSSIWAMSILLFRQWLVTNKIWKCEREKNKIFEAEEEEFEVFMTVISYLIMVIGTSYSNKYRFREILWDENEHAHHRFIWLQTLECETTSIELLRLNRATFRKLYDILQSRGGLKVPKMLQLMKL